VGLLTALVKWAVDWAGDLALLLTGVVTELHPIKRSLYKNIEY